MVVIPIHLIGMDGFARNVDNGYRIFLLIHVPDQQLGYPPAFLGVVYVIPG